MRMIAAPVLSHLSRLLVALATMGCLPASSAVITVGAGGTGDHSVIQGGVAVASEGDTVLVLPGTYTGPGNSEINFEGKNLTLASRDGSDVTIIVVSAEVGIRFESGEDERSMVRGFTMTGGVSFEGHHAVLVDGSSPVIAECVFTENGGIAVRLTGLTSAEVTHCEFIENGSGIRASDQATISDCSFLRNGPGRYGSGAIRGYDNVTIERCTFLENSSTYIGGAVYLGPGRPVILDCTFTGNTVVGTYASWGDGGAIFAQGRPYIARCTFTANSASRQGGAICLDGAHRPLIVECEFSRNTAHWGGGVYMGDSGENPLEMATCTFEANTAEMGGGLYVSDRRATIHNCLFLENQSQVWGGGAAFVESDGTQLQGCTFIRNASHRGGALHFDASEFFVSSGVSVAYCTLVGNRADDAGGIACTRESWVEVTRSIIAFTELGTAIYCGDGHISTISCVLYGNEWGDGLCGTYYNNILEDPLFCDISADDLTLCQNSPCLPNDNNFWVHIGAHEQGCDSCSSPVERTTWGAIKGMYR